MRASAGLLIAFALAVAAPLFAQSGANPTDDLAHQLLGKLSASDKRGVLVIDLTDPARHRTNFGGWLADQLASALAKQGAPTIEMIDRTQLYASLRDQLSPGDEASLKYANSLGSTTGANTFIMGSYGAVGGGLGITLSAHRVSEGGPPPPPVLTIGMINAKMPLTADVRAHLDVPLDSLRPTDGIYEPGIGGVSFPVCVKCPPADLHPPKADVGGYLREKKSSAGDIDLKLSITAEGRVAQVNSEPAVGFGIDAAFATAALDWEFSPATDAESHPVAVRMKLRAHFALTILPTQIPPQPPLQK